MGYVVRDGQVQKAHKVSLTLKQKNTVLKPTNKQRAIKERILKRGEFSLFVTI